MKKRKRRVPMPPHHYQENLACVPCGTDSSTGCVADPMKDPAVQKRMPGRVR
jgi:hypothetical protein